MRTNEVKCNFVLEIFTDKVAKMSGCQQEAPWLPLHPWEEEGSGSKILDVFPRYHSPLFLSHYECCQRYPESMWLSSPYLLSFFTSITVSPKVTSHSPLSSIYHSLVELQVSLVVMLLLPPPFILLLELFDWALWGSLSDICKVP